MSYAEFLRKDIFEPLGMNHTRVYNTRRYKSEEINNYAYGYVYSEKAKRFVLPDSLPDYDYVVYLDAITGDGTVNTSTGDFWTWDKALRENKLVSKETMEMAFSKHRLSDGKLSDYGYGFCIGDDGKSERAVYHGGAWPGYSTLALHFLDKETTVIIFSNNEYDVYKLADQIARMF